MNVKLPGSTLPPAAKAGTLQSSARSAQAFGFRRDAAQTLRFDDNLSRAGLAEARQQRRAHAATDETPPPKPARAAKRRAEEPPASEELVNPAGIEAAANQPADHSIQSPNDQQEDASATSEASANDVIASNSGDDLGAADLAAQGVTANSGTGEAQTVAPVTEELEQQVAKVTADAELSQEDSTVSPAAAADQAPLEAAQTVATAAAQHGAGAAGRHEATGRGAPNSADAPPRIDTEGSNDESSAAQTSNSQAAAGASVFSPEQTGAALPRSDAGFDGDVDRRSGPVATASAGAPTHGATASPSTGDAAALAAGQPTGSSEGKPAAPSFAQVLPQPGSSLRDDENVGRIARGLQSAVNQRGGAVTLRLNPPELGALRIDMVVRDGVVTARFTAEHESVRNLLMDQMSHLRQGLDRQGLAVDRLEVKSPDSSAAWMQQRGGGEGAGHDGRSAGYEDASQRQQSRQARRSHDVPARSFSDVVSLGQQERRG